MLSINFIHNFMYLTKFEKFENLSTDRAVCHPQTLTDLSPMPPYPQHIADLLLAFISHDPIHKQIKQQR